MPTTEDASRPISERAQVGARIRGRRRELGLTLQQVGDSIGVTKSYLGQVETGKLAASLPVLEKLSETLQVPIRLLVDAAPTGTAPLAEASTVDTESGKPTDRRAFVTRAAQRKAVLTPGGRAPLEVLTPDLQRQFEVVQSADPADGWHRVDRSRIAPEEFVHVLDGSYEIEIEETVHTLHPGDSMIFYPTTSYRVRSRGPGIARALWVTLPATS